MENKFSQILKNMNPETLKAGLKSAGEYVKTPQGKKMLEELRGVDKNEILKQLGGENVFLSQDEKDELLKQLTNNPELLQKLADFLK